MANTFAALPVPAGDGVGAWVDVSQMVPSKTISVDGGAFSGRLVIEASNDAQVSAAPVDILPFVTDGATAQDFVATLQFMRVRRTGSTAGPLGSPTVKVAAEVTPANVFGAVAVPAGDGVGAGFDVSAGGAVNTVHVVGAFTGDLVVEVSTDGGTTWSPGLKFDSGGQVGKNFVGVIAQVRVRRQFITSGAAPVVSIGSGGSSTGGGAVPAFGGAPPAWGPNSAGTAGTMSRSNHTHPTPFATSLSDLAAIDAGPWNVGGKIFVVTLKTWFTLQLSTAAAAAGVRVTALNKPGHLWFRDLEPNPVWWTQTAWDVSPATGSDENTGAPGSPLATIAEFCRRVIRAQWAASVTLTLLDDIADADALDFDADGSLLTVQGQLSVLSTQTVTAAVALNTATNQSNDITVAAFDFAPFVGNICRVQGTTNYFNITRALALGVARLSKLWNTSTQNPAGSVAAGQVIEILSQTKGPLAVRVNGRLNTLFMNDVRLHGTGSTTLLDTRINGVGILTRCVIQGTSGFSSRSAPGGYIWNGCSFRSATLTQFIGTGAGIAGGSIVGGTGLNLSGPFNRLQSFVSQGAPIQSLSANVQFHTDIGIFDLAAGAVGITASDTAAAGGGYGVVVAFTNGQYYGSGNNATAIAMRVGQGTIVSYVQGSPPVMDAGLGFFLIITNQFVPVAQWPKYFASTMPVVAGKWSGTLFKNGGAAVSADLGDPGYQTILAANSLVRTEYATSSRLMLRMFVFLPFGTPGATTPWTVTLIRRPNGAARAATLMQVTVPTGAGANTVLSDITNATLFQDADAFAIQVDSIASPDPPVEFTVLLEAAA